MEVPWNAQRPIFSPLAFIGFEFREFTNLTQQIEFLDLLYGDKKLQKIKSCRKDNNWDFINRKKKKELYRKKAEQVTIYHLPGD